ncbi:MAG: hypothetical protein WC989_09310 [Micavibrio sp.]
MNGHNNNRQAEKGNVLFLILIAVALFAALSYVVTQSTRSGSGSTEREKNILSGAQMTQYPTALRTSIIRMVLGGSSVENIKFDAPGSTGFTMVSAPLLVFHPQGGGASYQMGAAELSADGVPLPWYYNAEFQVDGIGMNGAGGNELIAFLPGVAGGVCRQVNEQIGINLTGCDITVGGVPLVDVAVTSTKITENIVRGEDFPLTVMDTLRASGCDAFLRQASGCFREAGGRYTFYSVLLER